MTNKIGEKIKHLRRKSGMTQENLSNYLGITFQAVSRWESGICYPDLEILPLIANVFDVTTDELLGVDITKKEAKIEEYRKESIAAGQKGDRDTAIAAFRKALHEFPNNYKLMCELALLLHFYYIDETDIDMKNMYYDEALILGEKILDECTVDEIRYEAIRLLVYIYKHKGEYEKAKNLAESMPQIYSCSDMLLSNILEGDDLIRHARNNIERLMFFMQPAIFNISEDKKYSIAEKIEIYKLYENLLKVMYGEDFDEIMKRKCGIYNVIAKLYAALNDSENEVKYLEKYKYHCNEDVKHPIYDNYEMKSVLFKGDIRQDTYIRSQPKKEQS
jgi:Predicted transcriptional regulators